MFCLILYIFISIYVKMSHFAVLSFRYILLFQYVHILMFCLLMFSLAPLGPILKQDLDCIVERTNLVAY